MHGRLQVFISRSVAHGRDVISEEGTSPVQQSPAIPGSDRISISVWHLASYLGMQFTPWGILFVGKIVPVLRGMKGNMPVARFGAVLSPFFT